MLGLQKGESIQHAVLAHRHNASNISRLLSRVGLAIVQTSPDLPDTPIFVTGAGILHTQKSNYGVLVKVAGTDEVGKELDITVRCTGGGVAEVIAATLKEIFTGKF